MGIINLKFFRSIGFYFSAVSLVTLIIAVTTYTTGFTGGLLEYNGTNVLNIALIGSAVFVALLLFEPTANLAPLALWISVWMSILAFAKNVYMYFTGIFFNGVTAEAFGLIDDVVINCIVLFVVSFVTSNIALYCRHTSDF